MGPLVTVVVISYNSSRYIFETLESIKNQTYENIELIISDDSSTDGTPDICKKWLDENQYFFSKAQLLTVEKNTGISANCNRGANAASGEWINFIAADDILLKDCLALNYLFSLKTNCDLIYSNLFFFNKEKEWVSKKYIFEYFNKLNETKKLKFYCRTAIFLNPPTWFIKNRALKDAGNFDESYRLLEDQVLILKFLEQKKNIQYFDEYTIRYRVHGNSIVQAQGHLFIDDLIRSYKVIRMKYLKKSNIRDILYMGNQWIVFKRQMNPHNLFFQFIYLFSPGRYLSLVERYIPNSKILLPLKRLII